MNEEQQEGDEMNQQWTAGEMTGDEKLGLKRLGDQWLWMSWREQGSLNELLMAEQP